VLKRLGLSRLKSGSRKKGLGKQGFLLQETLAPQGWKFHSETPDIAQDSGERKNMESHPKGRSTWVGTTLGKDLGSDGVTSLVFCVAQ